jgi:hypothetical protein
LGLGQIELLGGQPFVPCDCQPGNKQWKNKPLSHEIDLQESRRSYKDIALAPMPDASTSRPATIECRRSQAAKLTLAAWKI